MSYTLRFIIFLFVVTFFCILSSLLYLIPKDYDTDELFAETWVRRGKEIDKYSSIKSIIVDDDGVVRQADGGVQK